MNIHYPKYYEDFSCIAGACPDSCCKEWEVSLDPECVRAYQALSGPLGDRLRQVIRREDGEVYMTIENGRCPMWQPDGLCRIQAELGHDALSHTCRQYPRLTHEYKNFTELDLELSCPEAARLIFFGNEQMQEAEYPQDDELMSILLSSRRQALDFLTGGGYSLPQKLAILLLYTHSLQAWIDGGEPAVLEPDKALKDAVEFAGKGDMGAIAEYYVNLEILTDRWAQRLNSPTPHKNWDEKLVRFMTYGIRRYWLQAVSDFDLLCRVKFLIGGCLLIRHLGGDTVQTAQLWSKEIENDADNVDALLDAAYTHPGFTDRNLLSCIFA